MLLNVDLRSERAAVRKISHRDDERYALFSNLFEHDASDPPPNTRQLTWHVHLAGIGHGLLLVWRQRLVGRQGMLGAWHHAWWTPDHACSSRHHSSRHGHSRARAHTLMLYRCLRCW